MATLPTALTALSTPAVGDLFCIYDIDEAGSIKMKKTTYSELAAAILESPTITGTANVDEMNVTTVDATNATKGGNDLGYLGLPQNSQSADYTLVLGDAGKQILHPSADTSARTFTIPANASVAFPVGTAVTFINQDSGGDVTISITSDTMRLAGAGTTGSRTLAENGIATAVKVTSTEWLINGVNLT